MEAITYSLQDGDRHSDCYYQEIPVFVDQVLIEAQGRIGDMLAAFLANLGETGRELPRGEPEYVLDLLTLGVLWQVYGDHAIQQAEAPRPILKALADIRERVTWAKPAADLVRGLLSALFLNPNHSTAGVQETVPLTLDRLDSLLSWLEATGTFREEVKRISLWRDFLREQNLRAAESYLKAVLDLADWFQANSLQALGRYTPNVESFLTEVHPRYRWREDAILCGRQRVEYHLCMVGTEILNRSFRDDFVKTQRKVVLLPPCMRPQPDDRCQAVQTPFGERCTGCTPGCQVHQVTQMGSKYGFEVLILPDELSIFSGKGSVQVKNDSIGVVGVSCVLTNPTGGWETKTLNVPAQGVLLDYCGCSYHWHQEGIPTAINLGQLGKVLGIQTESGDVAYAESTRQAAL